MRINTKFSDSQSAIEPEIPRAGGHWQIIRAGLQVPLLRRHIPDTQIPAQQVEMDADDLARLDADFAEAS